MPYFPPSTATSSYYCPRCRLWYVRGNISCCVAHGPGTCCHEYERPVAAPFDPSGPFHTPNDGNTAGGPQ